MLMEDIIPQKLVQDVLQEVHNTPTGGHLSVTKSDRKCQGEIPLGWPARGCQILVQEL